MIEQLKTVIINNATTIAIILIVLKSFVEIDKSDKIKFSPIKSFKKYFFGEMSEDIKHLHKKINDNRANEIKYELSSYLKLAEEGKYLTETDIAFVREIYDEYHNYLGKNHFGTIMYEKIEQYYSKQKS